jgi:hypothetical protein
MSFDGTEGDSITLTEAAAMTARYRNSTTAGPIRAHFFGKDIINTILAQTDCMGIKIYYGQDSNYNQELVIVGVTSSETDMTSGTIADRSLPCPNYCDSSSSLNS